MSAAVDVIPPGSPADPSKPLLTKSIADRRLRYEFAKHAQGFCLEAIDFFVSVGRDEGQKIEHRMIAWREVLNRGIGRPKEIVEESGTHRIIYQVRWLDRPADDTIIEHQDGK